MLTSARFSGTEPLIAERTALSCALLYTALYVAPFYLSSTLRSTPLRSRDAPTVIQARVRAVGLTCVACTIIAVYTVVLHGHGSAKDAARLLGIWPCRPLDILKVLGLVAVLFVGPLYESIVVDGDWRDWSFPTFKEAIFDSWTGYRNLLIAPSSEELVFRSTTISVYLLARVEPARIVFLTPLVFGLAHIHHMVEFLQSHTPPDRRLPPPNAWIAGIVRTLFQFTYTSLFGFFAAFVYLRTGNLFACIAAHIFCNWQGVPRMYGRVGQYIEYQPIHVTPDVAQGKRNEDDIAAVKVGNDLMQGKRETLSPAVGPQNLGIWWTVVYYALIFGGAYGFYELLWPLTESSNALAQL